MSTASHPPIIIIGMHRSGTGMLCRLLEKLGLFVGVVKEWNNESLFFQIINDWLLRRCGAAYESPQPFRRTLDTPEERSAAVRWLTGCTRSIWTLPYFGFRRYLRYRHLSRLDIPWGWKDPRNTFTLPLWQEVFPQAKVIHLYRHGVDVAHSLLLRRRRLLNRTIAFCDEIRMGSWLLPDRGRSLYTRRLQTLMGGFSLWEEYMREARAHTRAWGARAMEIKYEDLLASPQAHLQPLVSFCNLQAAPEDIERAIQQIKIGRAYSFRNKPHLQAFAQQVSKRLGEYGYSEIAKD